MKHAGETRQNSKISITAVAANHSGNRVILGPLGCQSSSHFETSVQCFSLKKFSLTNTEVTVHVLKKSVLKRPYNDDPIGRQSPFQSALLSLLMSPSHAYSCT
jgi:hypothetical protein